MRLQPPLPPVPVLFLAPLREGGCRRQATRGSPSLPFFTFPPLPPPLPAKNTLPFNGNVFRPLRKPFSIVWKRVSRTPPAAPIPPHTGLARASSVGRPPSAFSPPSARGDVAARQQGGVPPAPFSLSPPPPKHTSIQWKRVSRPTKTAFHCMETCFTCDNRCISLSETNCCPLMPLGALIFRGVNSSTSGSHAGETSSARHLGGKIRVAMCANQSSSITPVAYLFSSSMPGR